MDFIERNGGLRWTLCGTYQTDFTEDRLPVPDLQRTRGETQRRLITNSVLLFLLLLVLLDKNVWVPFTYFISQVRTLPCCYLVHTLAFKGVRHRCVSQGCETWVSDRQINKAKGFSPIVIEVTGLHFNFFWNGLCQFVIVVAKCAYTGSLKPVLVCCTTEQKICRYINGLRDPLGVIIIIFFWRCEGLLRWRTFQLSESNHSP